MTTYECAVLAFRLLAVWFAGQGVIGLGGVPVFWTSNAFDGARGAGAIAALFPATLALTLGGLVWMNASWLAGRVFVDADDMASRVFGDEKAVPSVRRSSFQSLFALAVAVIGVLLAVQAVPQIFQGAALYLLSRRAGGSLLGPDPERQAMIWSSAAIAGFVAAWTQLAVGLALIAGPARLGAAYARVRRELRSTLDDDETPKPPAAA